MWNQSFVIKKLNKKNEYDKNVVCKKKIGDYDFGIKLTSMMNEKTMKFNKMISVMIFLDIYRHNEMKSFVAMKNWKFFLNQNLS